MYSKNKGTVRRLLVNIFQKEGHSKGDMAIVQRKAK
jgi:hypothetical protein